MHTYNSSYTKSSLTKNIPNHASPCSNFFILPKSNKMTKIRPKDHFFLPEIPKDSKKAKAKEDSYSGMRRRKLVTEAMVKPVGLMCTTAQCTHMSYILVTGCMYDQMVFLVVVFVYILTSFVQ